jgi:hypothetical protein
MYVNFAISAAVYQLMLRSDFTALRRGFEPANKLFL